MQLAVLGLNHKTVPVAVRECFSLTAENIQAGLLRLDEQDGLEEAVIVSTCNRCEVYAVIDDHIPAETVLQQFLFSLAGAVATDASYFYYYTGKECVSHLLEVAASLDSLVIGEGQILSQVKNAYALAHSCGTTDAVLNMLFQQAIATGKRVRTETHIAFNAVSVSYAAVQLAETVLGQISQHQALIYGAGQMGELTARSFLGKEIKTLYVVNRHLERARILAARLGGQAVHYNDVAALSPLIDIIITSTGAPHYVVTTADAEDFMKRRQGRPLLIIDIAVPRDVDPQVGDIEGITLYNIDDLKMVVHQNEMDRQQEAALARIIVQEDSQLLWDRFRYLPLRPVMLLLAHKGERIRRRELKRALTKMPDLSDQQCKVLEHLTHMLVRKLLRDPMTHINQAAGTADEDFYMQAMTKLFNLDIHRKDTPREK
jgi:glutamyl-tRNA reductase